MSILLHVYYYTAILLYYYMFPTKVPMKIYSNKAVISRFNHTVHLAQLFANAKWFVKNERNFFLDIRFGLYISVEILIYESTFDDKSQVGVPKMSS